MLQKIKNALLFSNISRSEIKAAFPQIRKDNRKFCIIWSVVYELFWAYCLIMTFLNPVFLQCRGIYACAFAASAVTLLLSVFAAPRHPRMIVPIAITIDEILLLAGIFIARNLAPRTIVVFAAVLIVPVAFISDTFSTVLMLAINIVVFALVGSKGMEPDPYGWVLSNLFIFSTIGTLLGHFVNRARFERYVFAESNAKLAKIQTRNAHHDQLTDLRNRRAYAEAVEQFRKNLPAGCRVVAADINGLKETNDTLGHSAGDELVVGSAECIRRSFPGIDSIYRVGGDEFCVIVTDRNYDVEKSISRLQKLCAEWKGDFIQGISISAAYASADEFGDIDATIRAADKNMYEVKRSFYESSGRDRRDREPRRNANTTPSLNMSGDT